MRFGHKARALGCENFVVGARHLPVWEERRTGYVAFLHSGELDPPDEVNSDLRNHLKEKLAECDKVIAPLRPSHHAGENVGAD